MTGRLGRRAALATATTAALGLSGALTGCTASSGESSARTGSRTGSSGVAVDPDLAALDRAATLSRQLLTEAGAGGAAADPGGRLAALHTAHLTALAGALPSTRTPVPSTSSAPTAAPLTWPDLRRHETAAQRELAHLAFAARSGAVASLLASMSAGIAAGLASRARASAP